MTQIPQNKASLLLPCKGRGKVVFGFLLFNLGLVFLLDTKALKFPLIVILLGLVILAYGHIQHYFVLRSYRSNQETD